MLDATREALSFVEGKTRPDLNHDRKLVLSLMKDIEIIGEAADKVTAETKAAASEIPWRDIKNMRNHLIHVYFDVDLNVLWDTVTKDLPSLADVLGHALSSQTPD